MDTTRLRRLSHSERRGYILILMVLIVCVIGAFMWFDPMSLMPGSGSGMPWDEEHRLVPSSEKVRQPNEG